MEQMKILLPGDTLPLNSKRDDNFMMKKDGSKYTTVLGKIENDEFFNIRGAIIPKIDDIVIGRVIRAKRKELHLVLLTCNNQQLQSPLLAELRSVDIQEHDVDNVIASNYAKPGDLIQAQVVALGRSGFYAQLSTAKEGMGVVTIEESNEQ